MATAKPLYAGATGTGFTCTLTSVANGAGRWSTVVNNQSSNLWLDAIISGVIATGAGTSTGDVYVLAYGYDGTNYPYAFTAAVSGADAAMTVTGFAQASMASLQYGQQVPQSNLVFLATCKQAGIATGVNVAFNPVSMSQAMNMGGLALPVQFGVAVVNMSGQALAASSAGTLYYNGIQQTIA